MAAAMGYSKDDSTAAEMVEKMVVQSDHSKVGMTVVYLVERRDDGSAVSWEI